MNFNIILFVIFSLDFHHLYFSFLFILFSLYLFCCWKFFCFHSNHKHFISFCLYFLLFFSSLFHSLKQNHFFYFSITFTHLKKFTLSFSLSNHFHRGLMPVHTPTMTRHTFNSIHSNNPMLSSPLFPRKTMDTSMSAIPLSPRFSRRPFPNKASPGL